jgi:hypothetical protein
MAGVALVAEVAAGPNEISRSSILGMVRKSRRTSNSRVLKRSRESRRLQLNPEQRRDLVLWILVGRLVGLSSLK